MPETAAFPEHLYAHIVNLVLSTVNHAKYSSQATPMAGFILPGLERHPRHGTSVDTDSR